MLTFFGKLYTFGLNDYFLPKMSTLNTTIKRESALLHMGATLKVCHLEQETKIKTVYIYLRCVKQYTLHGTFLILAASSIFHSVALYLYAMVLT